MKPALIRASENISQKERGDLQKMITAFDAVFNDGSECMLCRHKSVLKQASPKKDERVCTAGCMEKCMPAVLLLSDSKQQENEAGKNISKHVINIELTLPAWVAEQHGKTAAGDLMVGAVIADTDCPNGLSAGWNRSPEKDSHFDGDLFVLPVVGNVDMEPGYKLRAIIDSDSDILCDVDGFDGISDAAFDDIAKQISSRNETVISL